MVTETYCAEDILAGHPDRVCDAIAERIVDCAVALDSDALVGVEVGIHRETVFVTGRVAAADLASPDDLRLDGADGIVAASLAAAGYVGRWALCPAVLVDLDVGPLASDERGIRVFADDQNVVVGHALRTPDRLPVSAGKARAVRQRLQRVRDDHPDLLGPDGKVLVGIDRTGSVTLLNISVQHTDAVGLGELFPLLAAEVAVPLGVEPERLVVNGAGVFTCGGPRGDNGLSGKKLVVDHYGPGWPIGGGALCGKDPHKIDRVGALRARQMAVRLLDSDPAARSATATLAWLPGRETPDIVSTTIDGTPADPSTVGATDLSIRGSHAALDLATIRWTPLLRTGTFGNPDLPWEK